MPETMCAQPCDMSPSAGLHFVNDMRNAFLNIAPFLFVPDLVPLTQSVAPIVNSHASRSVIYNTNLMPLVDNFYLSDVITKSSITMGKCASQFKTNNFMRSSR